MSDQSPEVIELQMSDTRESLTQKINALETHVVDTLHNATSTVSDLLDSAKTVVPDTVADMKEAVSEQVNTTFNVTQHTKDKPWAMVGGSAALGFIVGMWLFRRGGQAMAQPSRSRTQADPFPAAAPKPAASAPSAPSAPIRLPGWLDQIVDKLASKVSEEVRKLGEVALDTVSTSIQHTLEHSVPKLLDTTVNAATREREPVHGSPNENGFHSRI